MICCVRNLICCAKLDNICIVMYFPDDDSIKFEIPELFNWWHN